MTSQLDQSDVASFDRRVAEMKKNGGNPNSHSHTAPSDMGKQPGSSMAAVKQFETDWSRFEAVFARGMYGASQNDPSRILR